MCAYQNLLLHALKFQSKVFRALTWPGKKQMATRNHAKMTNNKKRYSRNCASMYTIFFFKSM